MKLCFNTIACRNSVAPLPSIVDRLAALGSYSAVELWLPDPSSLSRDDEEALLDSCRRNGLDLPVVSGLLGQLRMDMGGMNEQLDLCHRLSELAERLGARYLRCFPGMVGQVTSRDIRDAEYYVHVVDACRRFCRIIEPRGQSLLYETHCDTYVDTAGGALRFIRDVGASNHGLILQLGVVPLWSGMNAVDFYRSLAPHVRHMHLHPYPWMEHGDNLRHYAMLLPVLDAERADFYVSVENCDGHVPPLEAAEYGAELIRRFVSGEKVEPPGS